MADIIHTAIYEQGTGDNKISVRVYFDLENKEYKIKDLDGLDLRVENYEEEKFTNLIALYTTIKAAGDLKFA